MPENRRVILQRERTRTPRFGAHTGISIKPISVEATERIVSYAFEYARDNNRRMVTAVHKANIMKYTDGLFLATATEVAKEYPDIEFEERIVDNMCMQLVQKPELYDVIVLPEPLRRRPERPGRRAWSAASVLPRAPTSARTRRSSSRPTGRPRSMRARTRSTRWR